MFGVDSQVFDMIFEAHDQASPVIESLGEKMRGMLSIGAGGILAGLGFEAFAGIEEGLSGLIGGAIQANMNVQSLQMTLQAIYGDAREATDAFAWVTAFEKRVPFNLQDIQQAAVSVAALGDDISKVLPALATMSSVAQVPLQTATQAFQDAQNGLNRMLERDLHVRPEELVPFGLKIDSSGKEDLTTFAAAFEKFAAARYPDAIANQMGTLQGKLSSLETQWYNIEIALGKPVFNVLQVDAQRLLDWLNTHQNDVKQFATNVGEGLAAVAGTLSLAVPKAIQMVQDGIAGVKKEWDTLKTDIGDVGDFFSGVGEGIHEVLFTVTKGLVDLMNSMFDALGTGINAVLGFFDQAMQKLYTFSGGKFGEPAGASVGKVDLDLTTQNMQRDILLHDLFPDLNPRTGKPFSGSGSDTTTTDYGLYLASGGTLKYVGPSVGSLSHGGGAGGSGSNGNPDLSVRGLGGEGDTQAIMAAAQRAYKDAVDRFDIDFSKNKNNLTGSGVQSLLKGDITTILKDMVPLLGYDTLDVQKAQQAYLAQIAQSTAKTAAVMGGPYAHFAANQYASEGSTIAAFGSPEKNGQAQMIAHLREMVAGLTQQVALLQALLRNNGVQISDQKMATKAALSIAQTNAQMAQGAGKPHQSSDPRSSHGLVAIHR